MLLTWWWILFAQHNEEQLNGLLSYLISFVWFIVMLAIAIALYRFYKRQKKESVNGVYTNPYNKQQYKIRHYLFSAIIFFIIAGIMFLLLLGTFFSLLSN
jgi:hypothetical protein